MSGIYLASKSPRRSEILKLLEVEFEVLNYPHEASVPFETESAYDFVERNTKEKSLSAFAYLQENQKKILPVLTADTIVSLGGKILGKPENKDHAISMLLELSGQSHEVISCVSLGILDISKRFLLTCKLYLLISTWIILTPSFFNKFSLFSKTK